MVLLLNTKTYVNLCLHKDDFGISAEWHFSTVAARASLQRPYNDQIMTPRQLFDWASTAVPSVHFGYCSMEDYEREQHNLERRFHQSRTIPGTRKLHSFVPISKSN